MRFLNREKELGQLDELFKRRGSQFLVIYGRRRIGKTALINHWLNRTVKKDFAYWVAHRSSSEMLLQKFSRSLAPCLPGVGEGMRFQDWEAALRQVFEAARDRRVIVTIDEFPYLVQAVPEFPGILQMLWDQHAEDSNLFLILSGSHYHMMREEFLSGRGPLYGRSTADMLLEEIPFGSIKQFLPRYSPEQIVETCAIIGGVPKYLDLWDDQRPVLKNVETLILSPVTIFRQEALFLIQDEIPEPRTYLAILEALGNGLKSPKAIADRTGIAINHMGKYLATLLDLGFIRKVISLEAQKQKNTRMSRYEMKDSYLKFYFSYIHTNLELLEQGRIKRLMQVIRDSYDSHIGKTGFEELARRRIIELGDAGELSFVPDSVGRMWNREVEIDVAAIQRRSRIILLGECKWSSRKVNETELKSLKRKASLLKKIDRFKIHYALFSKSGFTATLLKVAAEEGVMLFEGPEMERIA